MPSLCVSLHTAHAQEDEGKGPAVRALLLVPGSPNMELVSIAGETVSEPFNVGASGLSQRFYPGVAVFKLGVKDEKEETGYRSLGEATIPSGGRDYILLLEPVGDEKYNLHIIDGASQNFRANSTLFFNASEEPVSIMLGDSAKVIAPHRIEIVSAPPAKDGETAYQVQMQVSHPDGSFGPSVRECAMVES